MAKRILVVDDDRAMCELIEATLTRKGYEVEWATEAQRALELLGARDYDAVLMDVRLGGVSGLVLCERIVANRPDLPVIVLTAFGNMQTAVAAIRAGAYDFITKPVDMDSLEINLERAIQHHDLRREVKRLRQAVEESAKIDSLVGDSPPMQKIYDLVARIARSDATVLISGESGTGKELVAKALHNRSDYAKGPFVAINCAAMPATLLESELFGHAAGAYTGARGAREGLFVQARGGTLFLDEIGELPLEMQPKLLRALQERRVRPIGSNHEVEFDARIICATNRDLEADVEQGRFREDLYYRINVVGIEVPPLRARGNDILLLAQHFIDRAAKRINKPVAGLSSAAAQKLLDYEWPGNVRELENCVERAVTLTRFEDITVEDLPDKIQRHESAHIVIADDDPDRMPTLEELERRYIQRALRAVGGNKTRAARVLGLDRRTLYRRLEKLGIPEQAAV